MISFISIEFLIFVSIVFLLYFLAPFKWRWKILLLASLYFYCCSGILKLLFVVVTAGIAYGTAYRIEKIYSSDNADKKKARKCLILGIALIISIWIYSKIGHSLVSAVASLLSMDGFDLQVIIPLGISYYSFSLIGYMADVYWKKEKAECNYYKLLLYMIYFPHILQGPIARHRKIASQLTEGHPFHYQNFCYGLQRMLWGYFKKMVIADRFAMITKEVFGNYSSYEGMIFLIAAMCAAIELNCDFSGCMDIALGISEAMSIQLDENFRRPFFAKSAAEFWRRWHITLGAWFKDYVYMPLVTSPVLAGFCQKVKRRFGNRCAKSLMSVIPLTVVWLLTGLWHGTGWNYVAWGCYWGIFIILSTVAASEMKQAVKRLKINAQSNWYQVFRIVRTFFLFLFSRLLIVPGDLKVTGEIIQRMFMKWNPEIFFGGMLYGIGLDQQDLWVGIIAVLILWGVEFLQEKGIDIRERVVSYPLILRWGIYYAGIFAVLIFGIYGLGEDSFIYMYF